MTSAILPAKQIVKACDAAIGLISQSGQTHASGPQKVALLIDLQNLAAAAADADGTVMISLDDFSLISENYRSR
ncbi:hypothetical protein [Acidisphaera sp. L21]|uniref:hypothetical protein n=1 Tax=Acidisphaera sp. L21 TaxID=1641851 RepID=UPI00131DCD9C|nr:hypothetical protein [Acidisphaera sp. L21]